MALKRDRHGQPDKFENFPKGGLQPPQPSHWISLCPEEGGRTLETAFVSKQVRDGQSMVKANQYIFSFDSQSLAKLEKVSFCKLWLSFGLFCKLTLLFIDHDMCFKLKSWNAIEKTISVKHYFLFFCLVLFYYSSYCFYYLLFLLFLGGVPFGNGNESNFALNFRWTQMNIQLVCFFITFSTKKKTWRPNTWTWELCYDWPWAKIILYVNRCYNWKK